MTPLFDAHLHPSLKKQFADPGETAALPMLNPWRTALRQDFLQAFAEISPKKCFIKPFVESTLVSQASLTQLAAGQYALAIAVLYFPDKELLRLILSNKLFESIVKKSLFGSIITEDRLLGFLNAAGAFDTVLEDLHLLSMSDGQRTVRFYNGGPFQPGAVPALVFSVEGLHCLRSDFDNTDPARVLQNIRENLDTLLARPIKLISVNIAHIDNSNELFANQAYAVDGFREGAFDERALRPAGNGLTQVGKDAVSLLYEKNLLPDVKHMSWKARRELYAFRKAAGFDQPVICSHAGFAGCWFDSNGQSLSDYILAIVLDGPQSRLILGKPNPYFDDHQIGFNASSINLFNEDIAEIFLSGGLIGLSMDQRILGYSDVHDANGMPTNVFPFPMPGGPMPVLTDSDYISASELAEEPVFRTAQPDGARIIRGITPDSRDIVNADNIRDFYHPRHFYLHVMHAMVIAGFLGGQDAVRKMLTQTLCIGSDFDGLIDGIDCCRNVTDTASLRHRFIVEFPKFLKEIPLALPDGLSIEKVADRIFYENGHDFVLSRP
ncbi:MAG: hypothetical protein J7576_03310 [Siphonobacter aquaeclarae]|nr:hypothetical protein [Siphonobacter aquaeclarae]